MISQPLARREPRGLEQPTSRPIGHTRQAEKWRTTKADDPSQHRSIRLRESHGLALIALVVTLAGCGTEHSSPGQSVVVSSAASGPAVTSTNGGGGTRPALVDIQLTAADANRTVTVRVGQRIRLTLAATGASGWTAPVAVAGGAEEAATAVLSPLRRDQANGHPADAFAVFSAIRVGTAQITSAADATCMHHRPACVPRQRTFTVIVQVQPAQPGGGAGPQPLTAP